MSVYRIVVAFLAFCTAAAPISAQATTEFLYDDFTTLVGWTVGTATGYQKAISPTITSSGTTINGVGGSDTNGWAIVSRPVNIQNVDELSVEMRAIAGVGYPNAVGLMLLTGSHASVPNSEYYYFMDYGEFDRADMWYVPPPPNANYVYNILPVNGATHQWHTYKWSRDAQGWWSLSIDGVVTTQNFAQDMRLTSFTGVAIAFMPGGANTEVDWIRISGTPIGSNTATTSTTTTSTSTTNATTTTVSNTTTTTLSANPLSAQTGFLDLLFGTGTQQYLNIEDNTYTSTANRNFSSELELNGGFLHTTCDANALAISPNGNFDALTFSDLATASYNQLTVTPAVGLVFLQRANLCGGQVSGYAKFQVTAVELGSSSVPTRVAFKYEYLPDSNTATTSTSTSSTSTTSTSTSSTSTSSTSTSSTLTTSTSTANTTTTTVSGTTTTTLPSGPLIILSVGWNLVGNGVEAPLDVAATFGNSRNVISIWKWLPNGTTSGITYPAWAFYTPAQTDGGRAYAAQKGYEFLSTINAGEGFWVNSAASFTARLPSGTLVESKSFTPITGTHALPEGWSLIATGDSLSPNQFDIAIATADAIAATPPTVGGSAGLPTALTSLWAWNPVQTSWYFMAPKLVNSGGQGNYNALKGYLDFSTLPTSPPGTLSPTTGFWVNIPAPN